METGGWHYCGGGGAPSHNSSLFSVEWRLEVCATVVVGVLLVTTPLCLVLSGDWRFVLLWWWGAPSHNSSVFSVEWRLEVGATVVVGVLLLVSLSIGLLLYLKYSERGTYLLQV